MAGEKGKGKASAEELHHQGLPPKLQGKPITQAPNFDADFVIVGSGLSGLTAALRLVQQGFTVKIVEVSSFDLGGRTRSMNVDKIGLISIGGTWSVFENKQTLSLANEVNCPPFQPKTVARLRNICSSLYQSPELLLYLWFRGREIVKHGGEKWWNSAEAKKFDRKSMEEWLNERLIFSERACKAVRDWFLLLETFPPLSNVSALYCAIFMYYRFMGLDIIKSGFKLPMTLRWQGGTGVFTYKVIDAIRASGKAEIIAPDAVKELNQLYIRKTGEEGDEDKEKPTYVGVEVVTAGGKTLTARRVIVATNPIAAAIGIRYDPPLPEQQSNLMQSVIGTQNSSLNIILIWKSPSVGGRGAWWLQTKPPLGNIILPDWSTAPKAPSVFGSVMDLSIDGNGVLRLLTLPSRVEGMSQEEIKNSTIQFLAEYYVKNQPGGEENLKALNAVDQVIVWNWMEEMPALPGVTFSIPAGALSSWGDWLITPHARVHWGGTERSFHGMNWMEGAVARGNEVAAEVAKAEGKPLDEAVFTGHYKRDGYAKQEPPSGAAASSVVDTAADLLGLDEDNSVVLRAAGDIEALIKKVEAFEKKFASVIDADDDAGHCHCSLC